METNFERAQVFVGNTEENYYTVGKLELDLLKMNGCTPESHVLEIGCGCLVAGRPIMQFLLPDRYVGIEPNVWLLEAVKEGLPDTNELIAHKRPLFLSNDEFDASEANRQFDFVIAHSILSHAAHWQCPRFLKAIKRVLAPSGVVIASLRFFNDKNELMGDSNDEQWVYPEVSYFSWETIQRVAAEHGYHVEWRKDYREFFVNAAPSNHHDWIRLTHATGLGKDLPTSRHSVITGHNDLCPTVSCNVCGCSRFAQYRMRSDGVNVIRCLHCGMGVVEQQPPDLTSLYEDAYYLSTDGSEYGYADYSYSAEFGVAWAASLIRVLAPHGRILDIGCADGHLLKKLKSSHERYGIEVNPKMAELCRGAGIKIISSDIYDAALGAYNEFFDVISAVAVFEHLHDLKGAVKIALELLRPDGILLFEVPLISPQHPSDIWFKSSLEHLYYPDETSLNYLFETLLEVPLIGSELIVVDYGSVFVGLVPKNRSRGEELKKQYHRLAIGPIADLKQPEERRFRFLFDCLHAANTAPDQLDLLRDFQLSEINPPFFQRLLNLWHRDAERLAETSAYLHSVESARDWQAQEVRRRDGMIAELQSAVASLQAEVASLQAEVASLQAEVASLQADMAAKDVTIQTQENELQIFRTSKLQRLRSTILYDKLSVRKALKIIYLVAALATPERMRLRLRPFVHRLKRMVDSATQPRPRIERLRQKKWPEDRPLISVVIPSFNTGRYIEETVDSVLSQTFHDFEIIVVEGGSTDDSPRLLRSFQKPKTKVYYREGRHLLGDNRNFGISRSRGKYICCLDADDKLRSTYLEKALFLLETYHYDIVSTSLQCFGGSNSLWQVAARPSLEEITRGNQFSVVAVFRKDLWKKAGGYHDWGLGKDLVAEDWNLWVRMMALGARATNIPEALMLYRVRDASMSQHPEMRPWKEQAKEILKFNEKYLTRRNYLLSAERNAAIIQVEDPYRNLVTSYRKRAKKPAVLLALPFVITGGADTVLTQVAEHLTANGFDLSVVTTLPSDKSFGDNTARYETITKQIYHLYRFLDEESKWKDYLFYLIETRDIRILFLAGSAYVYSLLPEIKQRFPHVKVVDQLFNEFGHIENNRKYARYIDMHVVANEVIKGILIDRFGEDKDRIRVVVHGVDVEKRFNPDNIEEVGGAASRVLPRDKFLVSFIGRFSEEKCPDKFVEMANLLKEESNLHFMMIGNGPEYNHIKQKIGELQLENKIYAPGFVSDLRPFLKISGVLVIPSQIEGIPIILMESLALGVPVIASGVGGIPSIIRDEFNGFVCQPLDVEAFARNIKRVARDQRLRESMKANAREYALRHLSVDKTNREYCNLFLELLGAGPCQATVRQRENGELMG